MEDRTTRRAINSGDPINPAPTLKILAFLLFFQKEFTDSLDGLSDHIPGVFMCKKPMVKVANFRCCRDLLPPKWITGPITRPAYRYGLYITSSNVLWLRPIKYNYSAQYTVGTIDKNHSCSCAPQHTPHWRRSNTIPNAAVVALISGSASFD